jgi:hypothetical protein
LRGKRKNERFSLRIIDEKVRIKRLQGRASRERKEFENEGNDLAFSISPISGNSNGTCDSLITESKNLKVFPIIILEYFDSGD